MNGTRIVLESGMLFARGRYILKRKLGEGGMSQVWAAVEVNSNNPVAIKVPHLQGADFALRFSGECRYYARLRHPNIVPMYASGEDENGVLFIVMDLLVGRPLRHFIGSLDSVQVSHIGSQAADGLWYMHKRGIWHRDIKPDNWIIGTQEGQKGHLWIIDLGIAKFANPNDRAINTDELPDVGTLRYMAPEQVRSRHDINHLSDIWSFGVTLYEGLGGQYIFPVVGTSPTPAQLIHAIAYEKIQPIQELVPEATDELSSVIMRCVEKNPQHRPQSFAEIVEVLGNLVRTSLPPDHYAVVQMQRRKLEARRERAFSFDDEANKKAEAEALEHSAAKDHAAPKEVSPSSCAYEPLEDDASDVSRPPTLPTYDEQPVPEHYISAPEASTGPSRTTAPEQVERSGVKTSSRALEPLALAVGDPSERTTLPMRERHESHHNPLPFRPPQPRDDGEVGPGGTIKMESGGSLVARARAQASRQPAGVQRTGVGSPSAKQTQQLGTNPTSTKPAQRGTPTRSTMTRQVLHAHPHPVSLPRNSVTPIVVRAGAIGAVIGLCCVAVAVGVVGLRHGRLSTTVATATPSSTAENTTGLPTVASAPAIVLATSTVALTSASPALAAAFPPVTPSGALVASPPAVAVASARVPTPLTASVAPMPKPPISTRHTPKPVFVPLVGDDDQPYRHPLEGKPRF